MVPFKPKQCKFAGYKIFSLKISDRVFICLLGKNYQDRKKEHMKVHDHLAFIK